MKLSNLVMSALLGLAACAFADEAKPAEKPEQVQNAKADAAQEEEETLDLLDAIGLLRGSSVVLEVGGKKLTWREALPLVSPILRANQKESDRPQTEKRIHDFFQAAATRGLLLSEAESMGITVSDEERKAFEDDLERNLVGNKQGLTKETYMASFNKNGSNMAILSFADALKLMKLDRIKFGNVAITDQELAYYIEYRQAMNQAIKQRNKETIEAFKSLLDLPGINTDDGFKKIAREYSEGRESDVGGILDYDFTREELAEINELKSFDWKVGETTPVFETENDLRIMRMLAAIPPEKEGEPEKYRVAQILHGKIPLMDVKNKEAIKAEMLIKKKKKTIEDCVLALQGKYKVSSRLFPAGLWEKNDKQETQNNRPRQVRIDDAVKNNPVNAPEKQDPKEKNGEK